MKGLDFTIYELIPCMSLVQISKVHYEQKKDFRLQLIFQQILQGTSSHCKEVDPSFSKYWALREDLTIEDGYIEYLGRSIIPPNLRKSCIDLLLKGHPVMPKIHLRAKQSLYWPDINHEYEGEVENCIACLTVAKSPQKESDILIEIPLKKFSCKGR